MFNKEKLVSLIDQRGLNLREVSIKCGIAYSTLRDLVTGKNKNPLANTLKKLSDGLEVQADYFIEDSAEISTEKSLDKIHKLAETNKIKTLAAHFEGEDFSDKDVEDIENFIKFVLSKKKK